MRHLTSFLAIFLFFSFTIQAQDLGAIPTSKQNIAIKLDESTGKIDLFDKLQQIKITDNYQLSHLEIEIFDSSGEYAGSLLLKDFSIPENEVDKSEKVKVLKLQFKHKSSGEEMTFSNVDFEK